MVTDACLVGVRQRVSLLLLLALLSWGAPAATVTLAWDPSPDTNLVARYKVYYGTASGVYPGVITTATTNTTADVPGLVAGGRYYFAATAVSATGLESGYSTELAYTLPLTRTFLEVSHDQGRTWVQRPDAVGTNQALPIRMGIDTSGNAVRLWMTPSGYPATNFIHFPNQMGMQIYRLKVVSN